MILTPTYLCQCCDTEYFEPGVCDWCPVHLEPIDLPVEATA